MSTLTLGGRYEIVSQVGAGGMARVYRATDRRLRRDVAAKVMHGTRDPRSAEMFNREAHAAASLQHPNIVQIFDYSGPEETPPYLVMELIEGVSLEGLIQGCGRLPETIALGIASALGAALAHAHERRVIHRDVKPANVLIASDGRVLLTDFGVAKFTHYGEATGVTGSALIGTPNFMSPEQILEAPVGPPSDVFALGALFYVMLTGRPPFREEGDVVATLRRVVDVEFEPLPDSPMAELVSACLQREPTHRPSAAEIGRRAEDVAGEQRADVQRSLAELLAVDATLLHHDRAPPGSGSAVSTNWTTPHPDAGADETATQTHIDPSATEATEVVETDRVPPPDAIAVAEHETSGNSGGPLIAVITVVAALIGIGGAILVAGDAPVVDKGSVEEVILPTSDELPPPTPPTPPRESTPPSIPPPAPTPPAQGNGATTPRTKADKPAPKERPREASRRKKARRPTGEAAIEVRVQPWGKVFVDGVEQGNTPFVRVLQVKPGRHEVRVEHPTFGRSDQVVVLRKGERKLLQFDLGAR